MNIPQKLAGKNRTERAVSPVIGVILMVAITVILAAVIGTFVLDLGQSAGQSAPQATLAVDANTNTNNITIEHNGGDGLQSADTRVIVTVGDSTTTFDEPTNESVLSVGGTAVVNVNTSTNRIDWASGGGYEYWEGSGSITSGISQGDTVTVELIDVQSQRVIYESEVTA